MNAKQYREQRDQALREKWRCQDALKDIRDHVQVVTPPSVNQIQTILANLYEDLEKMKVARG